MVLTLSISCHRLIRNGPLSLEFLLDLVDPLNQCIITGPSRNFLEDTFGRVPLQLFSEEFLITSPLLGNATKYYTSLVELTWCLLSCNAKYHHP